MANMCMNSWNADRVGGGGGRRNVLAMASTTSVIPPPPPCAVPLPLLNMPSTATVPACSASTARDVPVSLLIPLRKLFDAT